MKLAVFLQAPEVWGAEKSLLTLLTSAAAKNHTIDVYVGDGSPLSEELEKHGIPWRSIAFVKHRSLSAGGLRRASALAVATDLGRIIVQGIKIRRIVRNYEAAITFGLWETPEIAIAGRLGGTPVIFDFHVTFSGLAGKAAIKGISCLVNGVIAPSLATYSQAGIETLSSHQEVVPRPVAIQAPGRPSAPPLGNDRKLVVGIFGQVDERKCVLEVVEALAPYADSIDLVIVGARPEAQSTEYEEKVSQAIRTVGHGWVILERNDRVAALMSTCDVVLNTSRHEAFGRTVVEAACAGALPVVMRGGGPEEIVRDMGLGVTVSTWTELAEVILRLSKVVEAGATVRLTRDQIAEAQARYSPDVISDRYFTTVEQLAGVSPAEARRG